MKLTSSKHLVKITFSIFLVLALISEYIAIFVYVTPVELISYHTMNIFFIVFSMLGLFLSRYDKFATNAKTILVLVSVVGITWQAELAFNGKDLPAIASAILSLSFASILATFLLGS